MWRALRHFPVLEEEGLRNLGLLVEGKRREAGQVGSACQEPQCPTAQRPPPLTVRVLSRNPPTLILCFSTCVRGTVGVAEHPWVAT